MPTIGFPASPTIGQQWPTVSPTREWNGTQWVSISSLNNSAASVSARLASLTNTDDFLAIRSGTAYLVAASVVATYAGAPPAATKPAAMTVGQWTLVPIVGGLRFDITALPSDGGSAITALQYRLNSGAWTAFTGTGTGVRDITGLPSTLHTAEVRAVNAVDVADPSDTKSATPTASGSTLTSVQSPDKVETAYGTTVQQTLTAVGSGHGLVVMVVTSTGSGVPTISDSAGGSWAAASYSYAGAQNGTVTYYFLRSNVTSGLTWVRATCASAGYMLIGATEVTGNTLSLDASGGGTFGASTDWTQAFTSTVANTLFVSLGSLSNGTTASATAPLTTSTLAGDYYYYARGVFPTAGANNAVVTLADSRLGDRSYVVVKSS